jgi:hypothetical protein
LKKKNQKNFCPFGPVGFQSASPGNDKAEERVFLLLFVHKKKSLAFLPLALAFSASQPNGEQERLLPCGQTAKMPKASG